MWQYATTALDSWVTSVNNKQRLLHSSGERDNIHNKLAVKHIRKNFPIQNNHIAPHFFSILLGLLVIFLVFSIKDLDYFSFSYF